MNKIKTNLRGIIKITNSKQINQKKQINQQQKGNKKNDNQPDYINMPKNYIKKITNRAEFSSPKGQEIKNTLLSEVLTIEKDFQNVERVKRNNQKLQAEFEAKEKNMRKQEDIQLRIQNVQYIQLIQKNYLN
ncbi:hypothetical protein PPERSA_08923 [Pseudocohnilembus persalinus]|uniref:Uncharacterized protein n=1 Tax=Pseudocohnilembus persalinus TaxID=266149 RepID=A0A0V0R2T0_PSEPJ|nr:hypothetical protein PPERSA_08923 [Pseudocohnilembus persalinus]|eukprot:KRX08819.1 hypothetical protein PPERSA_08923 [Pseudocohnilembus persalinus]